MSTNIYLDQPWVGKKACDYTREPAKASVRKDFRNCVVATTTPKTLKTLTTFSETPKKHSHSLQSALSAYLALYSQQGEFPCEG